MDDKKIIDFLESEADWPLWLDIAYTIAKALAANRRTVDLRKIVIKLAELDRDLDESSKYRNGAKSE